jgi:sialic acid synthase SpsE
MPKATRHTQRVALHKERAGISTRVLRSSTQAATRVQQVRVTKPYGKKEVTTDWLIHYLAREKSQVEVAETTEEIQERKEFFAIIEKTLKRPVDTIFLKTYTKVPSPPKPEN